MAVVHRFAIVAAAFGLLWNGEVMAFDIEAHRGGRGIISDHPELLRKVAGEKGIALPKGSPVTP
jgi:hypothetical protein